MWTCRERIEIMERTEQLFVEAVSASLENRSVSWREPLALNEWQRIFYLAESHHVLPMVYESIFRCDAAKKTMQKEIRDLFQLYKRKTMNLVMLQTIKTQEYLELISFLQKKRIPVLTVKGIICRELYPKPDYRLSGDEDILIDKIQFWKCHKALLEFGMKPVKKGIDVETEYEISYMKPGSPLYIELHKNLFPPESDVYGDFNRFFSESAENPVRILAEGTKILTLNHTEHLFYLICHAYKHFLHSGFGIRQVCDIIMYSNTYGEKINWQLLLGWCREINGEFFSKGLFRIGKKYLVFDEKRACFPEEWRKIKVDESMLMEDILDAGVYGYEGMDRRHSSNLTLNEVNRQWHGKTGNSVLKTVFPPLKSMRNRFPFLKKCPFLLPAAWLIRILRYEKETRKNTHKDVTDALKIGNRRIELMREYKIIR